MKMKKEEREKLKEVARRLPDLGIEKPSEGNADRGWLQAPDSSKPGSKNR